MDETSFDVGIQEVSIAGVLKYKKHDTETKSSKMSPKLV